MLESAASRPIPARELNCPEARSRKAREGRARPAWYSFRKVSDMRTVKQDVESLLNRLPDDVSVEDIQYHLYVLDKVRRGLEDARVNGTLSQEEVESRFGKWLTE